MRKVPADQCLLVYSLLLIFCLILVCEFLMSVLKPIATGERSLPELHLKGLVGHTLEPGNWVFWKYQRKTALEPHYKGTYQVFLTTDPATKLKGMESWIHISQLRWLQLTSGLVQMQETSKSD